jgi:glycogen operon protein
MLAVTPGTCFPLGAVVEPGGVNFSVFSKNATAVELLLFRNANDPRPAQVIPLDPRKNQTFYYWHIFVPGLEAGQIYAFRVDGPNDPAEGHRFSPDKILLDPYGKAIARPDHYSRISAGQPGDNTATAMKSVVADPSLYDWEGDAPLQRPYAETVIYEMHVAGFTKHPSSGVAPAKRGSYAGLVERIPYLQELGVTAVELLPIFQYDEQDAPDGLTNYWGYSPISFFAPHLGYSSRPDPLESLDEFRDMVKALHRAGIEVILDVVYNHTAEGDHEGPTFCFRGLDNSVYYILAGDKTHYANYSGTGNTVNANNTILRRLMLDSLHYWVQEMHVDGFRFDLASILSRDEDGRPMDSPPTLWDIESDPRLAGTKLIAEAWDAAGLYQVGSFAGDRWNEWNGKFRDDVRRFMKGERDSVSRLPARFLGSPDLYGHKKRGPEQSINFVTAHDGFTLNDLVSYNSKHNEANGEDNRDGSNHDISWNHGAEGPTADARINALRARQVKNFLAITLLSVGAPMLLMGDEMRRTQRGNNNAYCQDNEISWLDWRLLEKHPGLHRFVRELIRLRTHLDLLNNRENKSLSDFLREAEIRWHGLELNRPDWGQDSHSLAVTVQDQSEACLLHIIFNAYREALTFELPPAPDGAGSGWLRLMDTFRPSPEDIFPPAEAPAVSGERYEAQPHSVVLLVAEATDDET